MRVARPPVLGAAVLVLGIAAACSLVPGSGPAADAPWKEGASTEVVTAAPDAGGVLSFRNCPTLDEARVAIPTITAGPDANAVPFKSMILQCSYGLPGRDAEGHQAGISVLVFDALAEGQAAWTWTLEGGDWGTPTVLPGLGDEAFATPGHGRWDVWVSSGRFGLHLLHTSPDNLALDELRRLADAALVGLQRPPR